MHLNLKAEIYKDEEWNEIEFKELKKGDIFRLIYPDTNEVVVSQWEGVDGINLGDNADGVNIATEDASLGEHEDGVWGIMCEPYEIKAGILPKKEV